MILYWIYWGDISSQNHTGFKCTTQQNIFCSVLCTRHPEQSLSQSHSLTLAQLHLPSLPFPYRYQAVITVLSVSMWYVHIYNIYVFLNLFIFFHPVSTSTLHSDNCQSIPVSMPLLLFCQFILLIEFYI